MTDDYTVACYYFPNYRVDLRNAAVHGPGWSEWELVKRAEPRFPGHRQPRVPLWGYKEFSLPYHPNVTVGWDPSPRTVQSDVYLKPDIRLRLR